MSVQDVLDNREIDFPEPNTFSDPYSVACKSKVVGREWVVTHSTRSFWRGKINPRITISQSAGENQIQCTFQVSGDNEIRSASVKAHAWGVMGKGKIGKLASWMTETPFGIADEAGEVRGDWRTTWAVLVIKDAQDSVEGVDLLATRLQKIQNITDALREVCSQEYSTIEFSPENLVESVFEERPAIQQQEDSALKRKEVQKTQAAEYRGRLSQYFEKSRTAANHGEQDEKHPGPEDGQKESKGHKCIVM